MGNNSNYSRASSSASNDVRVNSTDVMTREDEIRKGVAETVKALKPTVKRVKKRVEQKVDEHFGKINTSEKD